MTHKEALEKVREFVTSVTTAENAETISQVNIALQEIEKTHADAELDARKAKDSLVKLVGETSFRQQVPDPSLNPPDEAPTLDEAIKNLANNLKGK